MGQDMVVGEYTLGEKVWLSDVNNVSFTFKCH